MAGPAEEKWSIDKLDSSNWLTWKFQIKHLLLAKGLWEQVEGTDVLAEDANDQARAEHTRRSRKAFSTIVMAVSTSQIYLITACENAKAAWDALRNHYERETLANKLFLKKKYFRMEMKEGTQIEAHLKQMTEITDRLAAIGAPIAEEDQVVTLLGSLPESYSTLVTALEAHVEDVSLNFVQQALIHEEQKRQGQFGHSLRTSSTGQAESALVGAQTQKKKYKPKKKPRSCYGCGVVGHFIAECPNKKSDGSGPKHKAKNAVQKQSDSDDDLSAFMAADDKSSQSLMEGWVIDSGASRHMTRQKELLHDYTEFKEPELVSLGDGRTVNAEGVGTVKLSMTFKVSEPKMAKLCHVLYVPKLASNLFSVRAAVGKCNVVKFGSARCWIRDECGKLCGMGSLVNKMFQLDCAPIVPGCASECASVASQQVTEADLWHQRLGHLSENRLKEISKKNLVTGCDIKKPANISFCESCVEGKMSRKPFKPVGEVRSTRRLQLVHSDVCGPMQTESFGGARYFVTFTDDFSRCCNVYVMKNKSDVLEKYKEFEAATTVSSGQKIGTLRTDNGGEYLSKEFETYLKSQGACH